MVTLKKRTLFVLAGIVCVASACVPPNQAQVGQAADSQSAQSTAPQAASSTDSAAAAQPMLHYVCSNPRNDARTTPTDQGHPFNMGVSFVSAANGAPLSDVAVKVRRHGRVLLDFVASGSHCLFSAPEADYRIEGTYRGEMKFEIVQTGNMNAQIRW
jgi:hypothetical protein